jgi:Cu+-exporting ATPase
MDKERFHISGMTCSACSAHVEKSVGKQQGVSLVSVNLLTETMDVTFDPGEINENQIIAAVEKSGYGAELLPVRSSPDRYSLPGDTNIKSIKVSADTTHEAGKMARRLGISITFLILLMYVAMYAMLQDWIGLPVPAFMDRLFSGTENGIIFALTQFLLLLPILYQNRQFFFNGFRTLIRFSPNMDSLVALGASAAVLYGIFAMYRMGYGMGHGQEEIVHQYMHDLYFESAGTILTLITVGKYLESRSKGKTGDAIRKLIHLSPQTAIILDEEGREKEIPAVDLQKGDIFLVKPGSKIPADGIVLEGTSYVEEAAITGESVPVQKEAGNKVIGATMNQAGFLKCQANRVGDDTTLAQVIRLVEEAGAGKAPIAKLADQVAGIFVPIVMGIALLTGIIWLLAGKGTEFALSAGIAVLVISCPCALGLATPVAIMVGTGVGAARGILIKSGEALQLLREVDTVVLDKTGTVTKGQLKLMSAQILPRAPITQEQMLLLAGALEQKSEHPLAEAIWKAAKETGKPLPKVDEFKAVFGRGIEGKTQDDLLPPGKYYIGNWAYMSEQGNSQESLDQIKDRIEALEDLGMTVLLIGTTIKEKAELLGFLGVADEIRPTSVEAIQAWKQMGIRVMLLTGDSERTAQAVGKKLGIDDVIAHVLPQEKEQKIRDLEASGCKTAMIGDGINDAPALMSATVGIAIGAGTDVAIESADVILMKNDLRDGVIAIELGQKVIRNIKENLFWAFFYNSIGIPLAAGVLYPLWGLRLSPMFGAAAMSLSSIFVVGNALRLRNFKSKSANYIKKEIKMENLTRTMKIEGMSCGHCTARVKKALEGIDGVASAEVSLDEKQAVIRLDKEVPNQILAQAVKDADYDVVDIR